MQKNQSHNFIKTTAFLIFAGALLVAGMYLGTKPAVARFLAPSQAVSALDDLATSQDLSQFWQVWKLVDEKYPFADHIPSNNDKLYGAIEGLVASYNDPYTTFFPPKEAKLFNDEVRGSFGGVGMEIGMKDGLITVIAPIKNSPAEKAGIKSGDIVATIDSVSTEELDIDTALLKIRGDVGTSVRLGIARKGASALIDVTITRDIVALPVIDTEIKGDIFVIHLYNFSEDSAVLFKNALDVFKLSGKKKLIIDIRNNPGGYLDAAVDIASYFLPGGKTIVRETAGADQPEIIHQSKGYSVLDPMPKMVVLINGGSASASEILAGALGEHNVATLVGSTSFGKGSVQELINLTDGSSVKITVAKWLTPNGVSISEKGIVPKVVVPEKAGIDAALEKAIQLLK